MIMHRKGENGAIPFRSGRFFNIDTNWYFACREGQNLGPFRSRGEAANALKGYLAKSTRKKNQIESSANISSPSGL